MSTNYYAEAIPCKECGHVNTRLHIGKSSAGWRFLFEAYKLPTLNTYHSWVDFLLRDNIIIVDEYGKEVSVEDICNMVEDLQKRPERYEGPTSTIFKDLGTFRLCPRPFT